MNSHPSPDDICSEFAKSGEKLTIKMLDKSTVLFKGSNETLQFLAKLFQAQAQAEASNDGGFNISPTGADSALFSDLFALGIYVHRLPCRNEGSKQV
jgi:hypothetical protein